MSFKTPSLSCANSCFNCNSDFVLWKGRFRYLCRCCDNNFCYDCVQNYCALPHIGIWKEVRTCDSCYQKYNKSESEDDDTDNESNEIFFDSPLLPSEFDRHHDLLNNDSLSNEFQEIEEENAQYLPVEDDLIPTGLTEKTSFSNRIGSIDDEVESNTFAVNSETDEDHQLEMALTLSRIEDRFVKYTTSKDTRIMSEEEEIEFVLRLSALEAKAKKIVSRLEEPDIKSKNMIEDEELSLALAISKIEDEDVQSSKKECKPEKKPIQSPQVHCPICFEERLEYALIDCGHVVCGDCKPKLKECPICRAAIRGTIRVYITD